MTASHPHWTFDHNACDDVLHLIDHVARAVDGDVGRIELVSAQPNRSYLIVEDHSEQREVIVPAGSVACQEADGAVRLRLTMRQLALAPMFEPERRNERDYFDMLGDYFSPLLTARGLVASSSLAVSRRSNFGSAA